jgi:hypothetical protein
MVHLRAPRRRKSVAEVARFIFHLVESPGLMPGGKGMTG